MAKTGQGENASAMVSASSAAAQSALMIMQMETIMRRECRSATDPVIRINSSDGRNWKRPIRPR